ncbi:MAG: hypothetical protein JXR42_06015 [Gammaproteobacteria bacterium]|nr:hypothetical protein [Gammaproteobacteria bacterium]
MTPTAQMVKKPIDPKPNNTHLYKANQRASELTKIAKKHWRQISDHFTYALPGELVVIPNHIHAILFLNYKDENSNMDPAITNNMDAINRVPTCANIEIDVRINAEK